jgi:hypothetical protein
VIIIQKTDGDVGECDGAAAAAGKGGETNDAIVEHSTVRAEPGNKRLLRAMSGRHPSKSG